MATGVSTTTYLAKSNWSSILFNIPTTINEKETKLVSARMKFVGRNYNGDIRVDSTNAYLNNNDIGTVSVYPSSSFPSEPSLPSYSTRNYRTLYGNVRKGYHAISTGTCKYLSAIISHTYSDTEWNVGAMAELSYSASETYDNHYELNTHWTNSGWTGTGSVSTNDFGDKCAYWTSTDGDPYRTYYYFYYNINFTAKTYSSGLSFLDTSFSTSYYSVLDSGESSPWQSIPIEKLHVGDNNLQISLPSYRYVDVVIEYEYKLTPTIFANVDGIWKEANDVSVNVDGTWKTVTGLHSNIDGTWRES